MQNAKNTATIRAHKHGAAIALGYNKPPVFSSADEVQLLRRGILFSNDKGIKGFLVDCM
jgi:hypothetical protein